MSGFFQGVANRTASAYVFGMMVFQLCVWGFVAYDAARVGGENVLTQGFIFFFVAYLFCCSLVGLLLNLALPALGSGRRASMIWLSWGLLLGTWFCTIPIQRVLMDRYEWPSVGIVTARIGMTASQMQEISTAKLHKFSDGRYEPDLRRNRVAALHIDGTPTNFERCWLLWAELGKDDRVRLIRARILRGPVARAQVDSLFADLRTRLLAEGWAATQDGDTLSRPGMKLQLFPERQNSKDDLDHPEGIWSAAVILSRWG